MNENVNLYELMTAFWKENEYEYFAPGQISFYFFLLNRANSRHWKMPIKCETSYASRTIGIPQSAVAHAREALQRRGLLKFVNGTGKGSPPLYYLILDPKEWKEVTEENTTVNGKDNTMVEAKAKLKVMIKDNPKENVEVKPKLSNLDIPSVSNEESNLGNDKGKPPGIPKGNTSDSPNPHNIKDEKLNIKNNSSEKVEISDLEKLFLSDVEFQEEVIKAHQDKSFSAEFIQSRIKDFFSFLRSKNLNKREEKECKKHFINWFNKNLNNPHYGNQSSLRRPSDVTATSPKDYNGAF